MPIRFSCPHCHQKLKASEDKAGRRIACPKCKTKLTIPSAEAAAQVTSSTAAVDESAVDPFAELVVYDEPVVYETEAPKDEGPRGTADFNRHLVSISRRLIYLHAVLLLLLAAVGFAAGYVIGLRGRNQVVTKAPPPQRVLIQGRIRWEATTGLLADKGAVVIALPAEVQPEQMLPGDSLSPAMPMPAKGDDLIRTIEAWGGDYTRTNDVGEFELFLLPGRYHLLYVSHNAERLANVEPEREHVAELGQFFSVPHELIGSYRYRWAAEELDENSQLMHDFAADP
jgi:hypothetical protein